MDETVLAQARLCSSIVAGRWNSSVIAGVSRRGSNLIVLFRIERIRGGMVGTLEADVAAASF